MQRVLSCFWSVLARLFPGGRAHAHTLTTSAERPEDSTLRRWPGVTSRVHAPAPARAERASLSLKNADHPALHRGRPFSKARADAPDTIPSLLPTHTDEVEERLVNEEYKIWKKNTPFLYGERLERRGGAVDARCGGGSISLSPPPALSHSALTSHPLPQTWSSHTPWSGRP